MRWLIAVGLLLAFGASAAHAQTQAICTHYDQLWAKVSGGGDLNAMQSLADKIQAYCPVKAEAERQVAAFRARRAHQTASNAAEIDDAAFKDASETNTAPAYDDYLSAYPNGRHRADATAARDALAPAREATVQAMSPAQPADPCSEDAIDAPDPGLPRGGPEAGLPARSRAAYASRYAARAEAFKAAAIRCSTLQAALTNYNYAVALANDPAILKGRAELQFDRGDYNDAITDFSTAIADLVEGPADHDLLLLYADRAAAYDKLGMHKEEIDDLNKVVDGMGQLNGDTGQLLDRSIYKERLARAYYAAGDFDNALTYFGYVETQRLDWQDFYFIGQVEAQKKDWDKAIDALKSSQAEVATQLTGAELAVQRTHVEVALGDAYLGRGADLDAREAWDAFQAALTDSPGDTEAASALRSLSGPPPRPTFAEPVLQPLVLPPGINNLDADLPQPMCSLEKKFDYLDQIKALSATSISNSATIDKFIESLNDEWAAYNNAKLLRSSERIEYEELITAENSKWQAIAHAWEETGFALRRFYDRVSNDAALVVAC